MNREASLIVLALLNKYRFCKYKRLAFNNITSRKLYQINNAIVLYGVSKTYHQNSIYAQKTDNFFAWWQEADIPICFIINGNALYPDTTYDCGLTPVGIFNEQQNISMQISPNPSTGIFNLTPAVKISQLLIMDVLGSQVYYSAGSTPLSVAFDLSFLPKGIYFLKATDANGNLGVRKIIIQ